MDISNILCSWSYRHLDGPRGIRQRTATLRPRRWLQDGHRMHQCHCRTHSRSATLRSTACPMPVKPSGRLLQHHLLDYLHPVSRTQDTIVLMVFCTCMQGASVGMPAPARPPPGSPPPLPPTEAGGRQAGPGGWRADLRSAPASPPPPMPPPEDEPPPPLPGPNAAPPWAAVADREQRLSAAVPDTARSPPRSPAQQAASAAAQTTPAPAAAAAPAGVDSPSRVKLKFP